MRLIDADALKYKNVAEVNGILTHILTAEEIDNAPTVEYPFYAEAYQTGYEEGQNEKPQGDLISREALKEEIEKSLDKADLSEYEPCICVTSIYDRLIDNAPTVETFTEEDMKRTIKENFDLGYEMAKNKYERPQGVWVFRSGVTCVGYYKCNKCGEVERAEKNFCPNCGADMRGDTE